MKPLLYAAAAAMAAMLVSCAPARSTPQRDFIYHLIVDRPVTCQSGKDCDQKWARAVEWVQVHSALSAGGRDVRQPLRRYSKNVIASSTAGPLDTQFLIRRLPREDGTYTIDYSSPCDNHDYCFYPIGRNLRMHFVSTFLPLPPHVIRQGDYKFGMKYEDMPPEIAGAQ